MKAAAAHAANAFGASRVAIPGMQSMPSISAGSFQNISFPRIQGGTGANAVPNLGSMSSLLSRALDPKNMFNSAARTDADRAANARMNAKPLPDR